MDTFATHLDWTGATTPARDAASFSRDLELDAGPATIAMSSAPQFKGDPARVNPEQLLVGAVSACHALTYLFLAARAGIAVKAYADDAEGALTQVDGRFRMSRVVLHPRIVLERAADEAEASRLVERAHRGCLIGNSVLSEVEIHPVFVTAAEQAA